MSKRVVGIITALLLAAVGTAVLVAYVNTAEKRAQEGEELVEVYVVDTTIVAGTAGTDLVDSVRVEKVPAKVRAENSVDSLQALADRVASVDLLPGEQLVDSRFIRRTEFANRVAGVVVPEDKVEVTVRLTPERAVGGLITPGETVAVLGSFEPFELNPGVVEVDGQEVALPEAIAAQVQGKTPNATNILIHRVLITAVQQVSSQGISSDEEEETNRLEDAPEDDLLVTLALSPVDAERVVFTAEFGFLYLASERETVSDAPTEIQTRDRVFNRIPEQ